MPNFTGSIYDPQNIQLTHFLDNALKAQFLFHRDDQYIVNPDGEIVIVDEFTGPADAGPPLLARACTRRSKPKRACTSSARTSRWRASPSRTTSACTRSWRA